MPPRRDPVRIFQLLLHHPAVRALSEAARAEGVEAHLVGGILRDRFLALPSRDVDAMVSDRGRAVAGRLGEALSARVIHLGGKEFGAYRLVVQPVRSGTDDESGPYELDLWDREGTTIEADLARRDFTINAIALSTPRGELLDPFDGFEDLRHKVLRATTPGSFAGDPLRVLRLVRLYVQLPGFSADPSTLELARAAAHAVADVASERVREELSLLFSKPDPDRALSLLESLDLYPGLWLGRPGEPVRTAGGERAGTAAARRELAALAPRALHLRQLAGGTLPFPVRHRLARLAVTFAHLPALSRDADAETALERLSQWSRAGYLTRRDAADIRTLLPWDRLPTDEPRAPALPPCHRHAVDDRGLLRRRARRDRLGRAGGRPGAAGARGGRGDPRAAPARRRHRDRPPAGRGARPGDRPRGGGPAPGPGRRTGEDAGRGGRAGAFAGLRDPRLTRPGHGNPPRSLPAKLHLNPARGSGSLKGRSRGSSRSIGGGEIAGSSGLEPLVTKLFVEPLSGKSRSASRRP